jgi:MraZ protein
VFLSSHEKPLDAKRRLLVPQDFRASALAPHDDVEPFEGLYCFAAIDAACIECGGAAFFAGYRDVINAIPKFTPARKAMEHRIYAAMQRLSFDTAGRITLPETLCERFNLNGNVLITGLGDSFQIWNPDAYRAYMAEQEALVSAAFTGQGGV